MAISLRKILIRLICGFTTNILMLETYAKKFQVNISSIYREIVFGVKGLFDFVELTKSRLRWYPL